MKNCLGSPPRRCILGRTSRVRHPGASRTMSQRWYTGATHGMWLALMAALLGWMFDGFEMGVFPLVARPALVQLLGLEELDRTAKELGRQADNFDKMATAPELTEQQQKGLKNQAQDYRDQSKAASAQVGE